MAESTTTTEIFSDNGSVAEDTSTTEQRPADVSPLPGGSGVGLELGLGASGAGGTRRIIKASTPRSGAKSPVVGLGCNTDVIDGDLVLLSKTDSAANPQESVLMKHPDRIPNPIAESPAVARELQQEMVDSVKEELKQTTNERQRNHRNKTLQERRQLAQPSPSVDANDKENLKANPMSRFLSVFSVEASQPEHKRPYRSSMKNPGDEPAEKRLRASSEDNSPEDKNGVDSQAFTIKSAAVVALVAATVAVLVGLWNRSKGRKI